MEEICSGKIVKGGMMDGVEEVIMEIKESDLIVIVGSRVIIGLDKISRIEVSKVEGEYRVSRLRRL